MKVTGFFFFNKAHHVYHAASVAFELSKLDDQRVEIFCSTKINYDLVSELAKTYLNLPDLETHNSLKITFVKPSFLYRVSRFLKNRDFPGYKALFKKNREKFIVCDTLVSPSNEILGLKKQDRFGEKKFIYTHHGAGDGDYGFESWVGEFDGIFISNEEIRQRFLSSEWGKKLKNAEKFYKIGYPKFDLCSIGRKKHFLNDNPVFVYFPHFKEELSSWFIWGSEVVSFFKKNENLNLIVAPHISFSKTQKKKILKVCEGYDNIKCDVSDQSRSLLDMTYTISCDYYLGDVSSQIYEFIRIPRPCVFLNAHNVCWEDNPGYQFWKFGEVVSDINKLSEVLRNQDNNHKNYKLVQERAFEQRFFADKVPASVLAANILAKI